MTNNDKNKIAKLERALKVLSAPTNSYDRSTVEAAREIALQAMRSDITQLRAEPKFQHMY